MNESQKWFLLAGIFLSAWLIYLLAPILMPFVISILLAYLATPFADYLTTHNLTRTQAVSIVFLIMSLITAMVLLMLIPMLEHQIASLISTLPKYASWIKDTFLSSFSEQLGIERNEVVDVDKIVSIMTGHWKQAGGVATVVITSVSRSGMALLNIVMNLTLIPVVTFYFLRDWNDLIARVHGLLPRRIAPTTLQLSKEADEVLSAFLRGQFSVMLALGIIYTFGLWVIGLEFSLLIGMMAGIISFVPYLGSIVGVAVACIASLVQFHDVWHLIPVLIVFGIGQMLEGMLLTPWLVGDKIGLHPVAVIFAVMAGGQLFGFLGVLLALPVAAVIVVLLRHVHELYKDSDFYKHPEPTLEQNEISE